MVLTVLPFSWGHNFDFHDAGGKSGDFLVHAISKARKQHPPLSRMLPYRYFLNEL